MNGDDILSDLHRTDPWIAAITTKRIGTALADFSLPLAEKWDLARLTKAIQDKANTARGEPPQGNAAAKAKLEKLAMKAAILRREIARMGETAEDAAFWELFRKLGEKGAAARLDYEEDYKPTMLHPLDTIANVLAQAASHVGTQRPQSTRWRGTHRKEQRIDFAVKLIPVFQSAFDTPARANNWGAEYGQEHPWPDFYRRIYVEIFPDSERLNLPEVLQKAARRLTQMEAIKG